MKRAAVREGFVRLRLSVAIVPALILAGLMLVCFSLSAAQSGQDSAQQQPKTEAPQPSTQESPAVPSPSANSGEGFEILSDTQGVDFSPYVRRTLAALKRNWYSVMPEDALLGKKGLVSVVFKILPDGATNKDILLERKSSSNLLDGAALKAVQNSAPFEPLPSQFHGPYLELRIWFLYNLRPQDVGLGPKK